MHLDKRTQNSYYKKFAYLDRCLSLKSGLFEFFSNNSRFSLPTFWARVLAATFIRAFRESEIVPDLRIGGGKHFGNFRFFVSGVLNVLSSHFDVARTRFGAVPFPRFWGPKPIFKIWDFSLFTSSQCVLLLLVLLKENENCWRCFDLDFSSKDFSSFSFNVGMSLMLKTIKQFFIHLHWNLKLT